MPAPLAHLRVVDLTDLRGALAGRLLADLGADVVKVEPPRGDPGRLVPPFAGGVAAPDRSLPFLYRNANKRGAVLDLHDAGGWHHFCELCERADVLIENLGPEGERRHGTPPARPTCSRRPPAACACCPARRGSGGRSSRSSATRTRSRGSTGACRSSAS